MAVDLNTDSRATLASLQMRSSGAKVLSPDQMMAQIDSLTSGNGSLIGGGGKSGGGNSGLSEIMSSIFHPHEKPLGSQPAVNPSADTAGVPQWRAPGVDATGTTPVQTVNLADDGSIVPSAPTVNAPPSDSTSGGGKSGGGLGGLLKSLGPKALEAIGSMFGG